jgi:hypothetical protein
LSVNLFQPIEQSLTTPKLSDITHISVHRVIACSCELTFAMHGDEDEARENHQS